MAAPPIAPVWRRWRLCWVMMAWPVLCWPNSAHAQSLANPVAGLLGAAAGKVSAETNPAPPAMDWAERLAQLQAEHAALQSQSQSQGQSPSVEERLRLSQRLIAQIRQHLEQRRLRQAATTASAAPVTPLTLDSQPPYSILEVDQLRDQRVQLLARKDALETSLKNTEQELTSALQALRKSDETLRLRAEQHERALASQLTQAVGSQGAWELAKLQQYQAQLQVAVADEARPPLQTQLRLVESQLGPLTALIETARLQQRFDERDLQALERENLRQVEALELEQQQATLLLAQWSGGPDTPWTQRATAAKEGEILALGQLIALVRGDGEIWAYRASALRGRQDGRAQRDARSAINGALIRIDGRRTAADEQLRFLQLQQREFQNETPQVDAVVQPKAIAVREASARGRALQALMRQIDAHQRVKAHLDRTRLLLQRSLDDFMRQSGDAQHGDRIGLDLRGAASDWLQRIWQFELFSATETTHVNGSSVTVDYGVTVGKSLGALVLFVLGYVVARRLTQALVSQLASRLDLSAQLARVIQRWVLSLLVVLILLVVLRMARVPLTAFAFLGGALAIGIGFGAQNVIKNLISGVIILFERKVRVGDIVTVGTVSGEVIAVDLRASTIRAFDGIEAIIPNSTLLEQQVSNWTSGLPVLRRTVKLRLARSTDTVRARELMLDSAQNHTSVLRTPPAYVLLEDLQADGVDVALYYWLRLDGPRSGMQVDSDLRDAIDGLFRQHGMALALRRTEVQLLPSPGSSPAIEASA